MYPRKEERLLQDYTDEDESIIWKGRGSFLSRYAKTGATVIIMVFLLASNTILLLKNRALMFESHSRLSKFAELEYNAPVQYHSMTDYWGPDQALADSMWNNISIDSLVVALTDSYASSHNLPVSKFRFPWDRSKGVYFLKVYHDLHCLKGLRQAFIEYERGLPHTVPTGHVHHCLDALRQDVLCSADDTPMPGVSFPDQIADGQIRQCRNMDDLVKWVHEAEREACYHRLNDQGGINDPLERYAFCPEDSEYAPIQKAYFEKWGHTTITGGGG